MKHIFSYEVVHLKDISAVTHKKAIEVHDAIDLEMAFEDFERFAAFEDIDFSVYDKAHVTANLLIYGEAILSYGKYLIKFKWEEA